MHAHFAFFVADDDERILEYPTDDIVAGLGDLRLMADKDSDPAEESLLFEFEDRAVVVDVRWNHSAPHVVEHTMQLGHDDPFPHPRRNTL